MKPGTAGTALAAWLLLLVASADARSADAPTRLLENGRWEMISPPLDVEEATLAGLFGDELPATPADYGQVWAVFRTVAPSGPDSGPGYELVPLDGTLAAGEGYWMIQATGDDVTVALPAEASAPGAARERGCPSVAGCASAPLRMVDDGRDYLWNLTGLPITEATPLSRSAVLADAGACANGCDFAAAEAARLMHDEMWRYVDRDGQAYEKLTQASTIEPWDAVWVPVLGDAPGRGPRWVVGTEVPEQRPDLESDYTLAFEDDFDGPELDASKWNTGHIWGPYKIINNELQLYVDTLRVHADDPGAYDPFVFTADGTMKIVASRLGGEVQMPVRPAEGDPVWNYLDYGYHPEYDPAETSYLSGILTSYDSFRFAHGYAEIRAKAPKGPGLWPAFWMLPGQYVEIVPEIDIVEHLGQNANEAYHTYHFFDRSDDPDEDWQLRHSPTHETVGPDFSADFHTYGVAWEPGQLIYYVDGMETRRVRTGDPTTAGTPTELPRQAMFLLVNLAVGGDWPGPPTSETVFPAEYELDWIRVWKKDVTVPVDLDEYTLAFGDEFDGNALDASKWNTAFLWGPHLPINCEEQYYVDALGIDADSGYSPFEVADGHLTITAAATGALTPANVPTPTPDPLPGTLATTRPEKIRECIEAPFWKDRPDEFRPGTKYTSGIITSYDAFQFVEGYAEIRAKVPAGDGLWPAFWLLNSYYVHEQPEIDVMEIIGEDPGRVYHNFHRTPRDVSPITQRSFRPAPSRTGGSAGAGFADGFHTFAVQWMRGEIVWYVDGEISHRYAGGDVAEQLMYVIANLAVGGNYNSVDVDAESLPAELVIDHIRVYQQKDTP